MFVSSDFGNRCNLIYRCLIGEVTEGPDLAAFRAGCFGLELA